MPEGPEVYILAKSLKSLGYHVESCGKHILLKDWNTGINYDISFGIAGRLDVQVDKTIKKIDHPNLPSGDMKIIESFNETKYALGVDWLTATRDEIKGVVDSWAHRKKQIGALLLDQHEICGIGVAWGSEILGECGIRPTEKANLLNFLNLSDSLVDSIINIREKIVKIYSDTLKGCMKSFAQRWFENLYSIRKLKFYKSVNAEQVSVSGRIFYF